MIFVYDKSDDPLSATSSLNICHTIFVDKEKTGDYQTTSGICHLLQNNANADDLLAFFEERLIPFDSTEAMSVAEELLSKPPEIGFLTISNALQWRLQYGRVIEKAGQVNGVIRVS